METKREVHYFMLDLMDEHGLSQAEVARRAGVPPSSMSRYVKGGDMPASTAKAIADAIGVTVDELLGVRREEVPSDEAELLAYYRACSVRGKANLLEYAEDTARRHPKNSSVSQDSMTA